MKRLPILLLTTVCLLLASCRGTQPSAGAGASTPSDTLATADPAATGAAQGTARPATPDATPVPTRQYTVINFNATVEGISASGQLRMATDSVMWISVSKFIELGRALATPDSVWFSAPLLNRYFAGTYDDLSKHTKQAISFEMLQAIAASDNAEERLVWLAERMGLGATVSITARRQADSLTFPFRKE